MKLNPLTIEKFNRFKSIKRGYYSLWTICILIVLSLFAEMLVNNRALLVKYN
ncbi:MAG: ABC transporter permease, partial [Spirochaetota bacterium]